MPRGVRPPSRLWMPASLWCIIAAFLSTAVCGLGLPAAAALDNALSNTHPSPTAQAPYAVSFQVHSYNDLRLLPQTLAKVGAGSRTGCSEL